MRNNAPRIVVIDDSAEVRGLIRAQFGLSGLLTVVADGRDGTEAIELAHRHQPDLLLLDMSMPVLDGLDALPGVLAVSPGTRVVVYTGFEEQGLAERARELGAAGFIEKSIPVGDLAGALLAVLSDADEQLAAPLQVVPDPRHLDDEPIRTTDDDQTVLHEHLERFREVFEQAAIGMATMTLSGGLVRANRALGDIMLRKHEDLVGVDYATLTAGRAEQFDEAMKMINAESVDLVHLEHDVSGSTEPRRVRATLAPVRDSAGQALCVFLQVQDITAQRAAEDELRESEGRFRLLVDAVEEYAIFMLDPDGIVMSWNSGAQRSKGYRADEIIGQHFRAFYPQDQQAAGHPEFELGRALRDGHYLEEGWRVRKDGTEFWANVLITAVFNDAGRHMGFAKVTRDVTANRDAEESLRQSEERFRLLVEAVGDYAIFMLDPDGRVLSWNAGAQRSTGYTRREILGDHFRVFYPPDSQADGHPERELEIALRDGRYEEEGWRVRKDGSTYWANVVITAVSNDAGDHVGFAKITRDSTDRRVAEEKRVAAASALGRANVALEAMNDRLQQAASDQSQFLAVTAHELRTPAAVLRGSADTLSRSWTKLSEDARAGLLEGMATSATRLGRLLSDLLTASRLDGNALHLRPTPTPITALLVAAADAARVAHRGADVRIGAMPEVQVMADPGRIAQAIDNLLGNAITHGAPPVRLEVDVVGQLAEIRVIDSGAGVDPAVLPRLFDRFATSDDIGGTGLGLFIVRELARANGGDAFYETGTPDQPAGAFVLSVPLV